MRSSVMPPAQKRERARPLLLFFSENNIRVMLVELIVEAILRLKIVQAGEPVLREAARPSTRQEIVGDEIQRLIEDMRETMRDAPGVGLAAPQVGLSLQLAVIEDREEFLKDLPPAELADKDRRPVPFHVVVNPKIINSQISNPQIASPQISSQIALAGSDEVSFYEGCLSLAGFSAIVPRARAVRVEYLDEQGEPRSVEASGWYARILQHEIDHLHGTLYFDRMQTRSFTSIDNWNRFWKGKPTSSFE
jgi:peptide deformylase